MLRLDHIVCSLYEEGNLRWKGRPACSCLPGTCSGKRVVVIDEERLVIPGEIVYTVCCSRHMYEYVFGKWTPYAYIKKDD